MCDWRGGGLEPAESQHVVDFVLLPIDRRPELAVPGRRQRRNLLVAGQLLADAVPAVRSGDRHDGDRERDDDTDGRCQPEAKRLHLPLL
jgi:hypothetical protein